MTVNVKIVLRLFYDLLLWIGPSQVPTAGSSYLLPNELITPTKPTSHSTYYSYKPSPPSYYPSSSYAMPSPPAATYPSVSTSTYSSSTRRSRAPTRSASLPRSLSYTPSPRSGVGGYMPSSAALRLLGAPSDGTPAVVTSSITSTWTPWRSARPAASRQRDEEEFYKRLRDIRARASSPVTDDLDLQVGLTTFTCELRVSACHNERPPLRIPPRLRM